MARPERYRKLNPGDRLVTQTDVQTFSMCARRYWFGVEGGRRIITTAMAVGTGTASGAKFDNLSKLDSGTGLARPEVVDVSVAAYDVEVETSEVRDGTKGTIGEARDLVRGYAEAYSDLVSPSILNLVAVEQPIVKAVGDGLELAGTPDYITKEGVGDLKTGRAYTPARTHATLQLTLYAVLYRTLYRRYPQRVWIDSLSVSKRAGFRAQRIETYRDERDEAEAKRRVLAVVKAMDAGVDTPAPDGAWYCSAKWCPYWEDCDYVQGRRRRVGPELVGGTGAERRGDPPTAGQGQRAPEIDRAF